MTPALLATVEMPGWDAFLAWIGELRAGAWANETELRLYYPESVRIPSGEHHFPLLADGRGVRARILYDPGIVRLLRVAVAPTATVAGHAAGPHGRLRPAGATLSMPRTD